MEQGPEEGVLKTLRATLAGGGFRLTQQRLSIYKALESSGSHPSCEDLFRQLRPSMPSLSMDTVYRTVGTLEQSGMIRKIVSMDGVQRYDANLSNHHHFVCERCFGVWDIDWDAFDQLPLPDEIAGLGSMRACQVEFKGICLRCGSLGSGSGG
ncbi:MAG: Fur family transcriptional regulator [Leptospirales bacterium]